MRTRTTTENSAFRFSDRVVSSQPTWKNPVLEILLYAGITFMTVAGALLSLISGYRAPVSTALVLALSAAFSLIFAALYRSPAGGWVFYAAVIPLTVIGLYTWEEMWAELTVLWNASLHVLDPSFAQILTLQQSTPYFESGWPFIVLLIFFLCMACGYTVNRNPRLTPVFFLTFSLIELVFLPGLAPNFFAFGMAIVSYGVLLSISRMVGSGDFHQTGSVRKKGKKVRMYPLPKVFAPAVAVVSVLTVCGLMLAQGILSAVNYTRPEAFDRARNAAMTMDWRSVFYNPDLARGMLSLAKDQKFDQKTDLIVTMPRQNETVYLKGYTGSVYHRGNWRALDSSAYEDEPFDMLAMEGKNFAEVSENFSDALMLSDGWMDAGVLASVYREGNGTVASVWDNDFDIERERRADKPRFVAGNVTVEPVRAGRQYAYLPYCSYRSGALSYDYDRHARLNSGEETYSVDYFEYARLSQRFTFFKGRMSDWSALPWNRPETKFPDNPYELEYRDFVKNHYLTVPDGLERLKDDAVQMLNDARIEYNSAALPGDPVEFSTLKETLRSYLREQVDYSLTPGTVPAGVDPVNYALYENHKGYCMHFASAATLMFRAMGVPARYVEGYVVTNANFNGATIVEAESNVYGVAKLCKMELKDSNSHAWTEIYAEGFGWIPVEVTPGYRSMIETLPTETPGIVRPITRASSDAPSSNVSSSKSAASSSRPSSSRPSSSEGAAGKTGGALWILLLILGLCAAVAAVVLLPRRVVQKLLERNANTEDSNANVLALYAFLVKLLEYERFSKAEYVCYAPEKMAKRLDFLSEDDCERWMEIVLKARFSGRDVEREEAETFARMVRDVQARLYARKTPVGKFFMKYVHALV